MNNNTYIRCIYSPGFSSIMMSFYKTNLALSFTPYSGKDKRGFDQYDKQKFLSTTIGDENVASLYLLSKQILDGTLKNQTQYFIQGNRQTTLLFEYKPDQNAQMRAYFTIEKNRERIPFEFAVNYYKTKENGQIIEKVIQSGLLVFMETLQAYLTAVGADRNFNKTPEEVFGTPQIQPSTSWS